jgi:hypothetical protein
MTLLHPVKSRLWSEELANPKDIPQTVPWASEQPKYDTEDPN